jgi:hypothetical protein
MLEEAEEMQLGESYPTASDCRKNRTGGQQRRRLLEGLAGHASERGSTGMPTSSDPRCPPPAPLVSRHNAPMMIRNNVLLPRDRI